MTNSTAKIKKYLGVTVLADFVLSEGVDPIVENLVRAGVTAVATNPTVTAPAPDGSGTFQPPADAGSSPRTFDREIFGKHALWVQSAPSFEPNSKYYTNSSYGPRAVKPLTLQHGDVIDRFVKACREAELKVYFQLGAAQPTGLRDEDRPRQVDGSIGDVRMADTGSLASSAIRQYNRAYVRDILDRYPDVEGFRIDWPEYPCYTMYEALHDFSPLVRAWALERGFDQIENVFVGMQRFHDHLSGCVTNAQLAETNGMSIPMAFAKLAGDDGDAVHNWLELKAALSVDLVADWRRLLDETKDGLHLTAHAFMPPYSDITGLSFSGVSEHCDSISPKFYTMHWPLMVQFWTDWLLERSENLNRENLNRENLNRENLNRENTVRTIASWMELGTPTEIEERLELYRYPNPEEAHPIPVTTQQSKLREVKVRLQGAETGAPAATEFVPLVHGYGPVDDFADRFSTIWNAEVDGVWINRYGYLSDEKLELVGQVCNLS